MTHSPVLVVLGTHVLILPIALMAKEGGAECST